MPGNKQTALTASEASVKAAKRRRFDRYAEEMAADPSLISHLAATKLAEALHDRGGWCVFEDH